MLPNINASAITTANDFFIAHLLLKCGSQGINSLYM